MNADDILTVQEVAAILKVSTAWVRDHSNGHRKPILPSAKIGGIRRFKRADVEAFWDLYAAVERDRLERKSA